MRNSLETRLGLFFALTIVAAILVMELSDSFTLFSKSYELRAQFFNAKELKKGDPVKMAGIDIGSVSEIDLADGRVEVIMQIDERYKVKTDSVATIQFTGLMGSNFLSISFGSEDAPALDPENYVQTEEQADFAAIMQKLEGVADGVQNLTRSFSGDNFTELLAPLTDFMRQNGPRVGEMVENIEAISQQIANGEGTVGKLIYEEEVYRTTLATITNVNTRVDAAAEEIRLALADARSIIGGIKEGEGTLGLLATDEALYQEMALAMTNLKEILEKVNVGDGTVSQLINDEAFFTNLKLTLQKLERATETIEDTGPLQVIGTAAGTLF